MVCLDSVMNKVTDRHAESVNLVSGIVNLVSHIVASLLQLVHKAPNLWDTLQHLVAPQFEVPKKVQYDSAIHLVVLLLLLCQKIFWDQSKFFTASSASVRTSLFTTVEAAAKERMEASAARTRRRWDNIIPLQKFYISLHLQTQIRPLSLWRLVGVNGPPLSYLS